MATLINKIALPATLALGAAFMPMKAAHASTGSNVATAPAKSFCVYPDGVTPSQTLMTCISPNGQMKSISLNDHSQRINQGFMQSYANGLLQSASERLPQGVAAIKVTGNKAIIDLMPNDPKHFSAHDEQAMATQFWGDIKSARTQMESDLGDSAFQHEQLAIKLAVVAPKMAPPVQVASSAKLCYCSISYDSIMPSTVNPTFTYMPNMIGHQGQQTPAAMSTPAPMNKTPSQTAKSMPAPMNKTPSQTAKNTPAPMNKTPSQTAKSMPAPMNKTPSQTAKNTPAPMNKTPGNTAVNLIISFDELVALLVGAGFVGGVIGSISTYFGNRLNEARKAKASQLRVARLNVNAAEKIASEPGFTTPQLVSIRNDQEIEKALSNDVALAFKKASATFGQWNKAENKAVIAADMDQALVDMEKSVVALSNSKPSTKEAAEILCSSARYLVRKNEKNKGVQFAVNNKAVLMGIIETYAAKMEEGKLRNQMAKFVQTRRPAPKVAVAAPDLIAA